MRRLARSFAIAYRGHVKKGVIVFADPVELREGTKVTVELIGKRRRRETLSQVLLRHAGTAKGLPPDASRNVDHYLYGAPKKSR